MSPPVFVSWRKNSAFNYSYGEQIRALFQEAITSVKEGGTPKDLGIVLPNAPHPLGAYVEAVQTGSLLFLSGMLPVKDGKLQYVGRLGKGLDESAGRDALRTATLNALSAAKEHLGSLDRVTKVVRVGVYLATHGDFYNQPIVGDAASELLRDVFGENKMSVRSVMGVASLPLGAPVMLEVTFEVGN